jgi:hypothetical protein
MSRYEDDDLIDYDDGYYSDEGLCWLFGPLH